MRPSKYEKEYAIKLLDFFSVDVFRIIGGKKSLNRFPTFERFAVSIGVTHKTLQNWCKEKDKEEFLRAYELCKDIQKALIIEGSMTGDYNAAFAKFLAVNVTDLRDKVEQEIRQQTITITKSDEDL